RIITFSADGKMLAGSVGGETVLWDLAARRERARLSGGLPAFAPDSKTLASGNEDGTIELWDLSTLQKVATLSGHATKPVVTSRVSDGVDGIAALAFSPRGQTLASAGWELTVRLWDPATRQEVAPPLKGHTDKIWSLAFAPDGK